jgi:hypothetical protein
MCLIIDRAGFLCCPNSRSQFVSNIVSRQIVASLENSLALGRQFVQNICSWEFFASRPNERSLVCGKLQARQRSARIVVPIVTTGSPAVVGGHNQVEQG